MTDRRMDRKTTVKYFLTLKWGTLSPLCLEMISKVSTLEKKYQYSTLGSERFIQANVCKFKDIFQGLYFFFSMGVQWLSGRVLESDSTLTSITVLWSLSKTHLS